MTYLTLKKVAAKFHVAPTTLSQAKAYLAGFPESCLWKGRQYYELSAIEAWAAGKDVNGMIKASLAARKKGRPTADQEKINQLTRRFFAGEFAPEEQQRQFAMKRLVARTTKPITTRVTIIPDWMMDDDVQPNRAHRSN